MQTVVRSGDGASGHAANECDVVEQGRAPRTSHGVEPLQRAEGESCGSRATARERHGDGCLAADVSGFAHGRGCAASRGLRQIARSIVRKRPAGTESHK
ncbi:hypothetical protein D3C72_1528510 [compost metagenome]